jgi:hypothetical protein
MAGLVGDRPSFRDGAQHQTRNLEIPGSMLTHRSGMTGFYGFSRRLIFFPPRDVSAEASAEAEAEAARREGRRRDDDEECLRPLDSQ